MTRVSGHHFRLHLSSGRLFLLAGLYAALMLILTVAAHAGQTNGSRPNAAGSGARPNAAAMGPHPGGAGMPAPIRLKDVGRGSLLFKTRQEGLYLPAPAVTTDVKMDVGGMVARVGVKQRFFNPTKSWLEGVYVFPLPENSAVNKMRLHVGDRVIDADIAERDIARRRYEKARREGRRAGLVEQERPNIFTTSVANIAPGEAVTVEIRYQQTLKYDRGRFRLHFPMVVGPRYIPGPVSTVSTGGDGWASTANPVPDAERISPPVVHPDIGKINPVSLTIALNAGFPLVDLKSSYHPIDVNDGDGDGDGDRDNGSVDAWKDGTATISLRQGAVPADRDFELVWTPEIGRAPLAGVFREVVDGDTYLLVMVLPPKPRLGGALGGGEGENVIPPRDAVFILDRSGSMAGTSIVQAKQALGMALDRLRPKDRFNVIWFNNGMGALFGQVRAASPAAIMRAKGFVSGITADGGTEMLPALEHALGGHAPKGRLRQVVFLTDGAVGNETQLFKTIAGRLGENRLFTIGIGSAPNGYFMRKAAEAGRGAYTHIGKTAEVASRMTDLFRKLERPVVTDLLTVWRLGEAGPPKGPGKVEAYPNVPPDLYDGEPLVLAVRIAGVEALGPDTAVTLHGRSLGRPWQRVLNLGTAREAKGVAALWGRSKIAALMDTLREGAPKERVRAAVTATALRHKLVSKFTSLVAVDKTPARNPNAKLVSAKAPLNLPRGWDYEKVFGDILKRLPPPVPTKAEPINYERRADKKTAKPGKAPSAAANRVSVMPGHVAMGGNPVPLPQGATASELHLLAGLAALLLSMGLLAILFIRRRKCTCEDDF